MTYHKSRICNFQEIGHDDKVSMPCVNDEGYVCNSVTSRCFERWVSHEFKDSPAIDILMQLTAPVIFLAQQFRACNWKLYRITSSSFFNANSSHGEGIEPVFPLSAPSTNVQAKIVQFCDCHERGENFMLENPNVNVLAFHDGSRSSLVQAFG